MKLFLDGKLAPLTFHWGFFEAPMQKVCQIQSDWLASLGRPAQSRPIRAPLAEALSLLEPLTLPDRRLLYMDTKSVWTAYFENGALSGTDRSPVSYLPELLKCRSVYLACCPHTKRSEAKGERGIYGSVMFEIHVPRDPEFARFEQSINMLDDGGPWKFETYGPVQPFEQPEHYTAARIRDRFTSELLEQYCRALGIDVFNPDFYGPAGILSELTIAPEVLARQNIIKTTAQWREERGFQPSG